jgi:phospholipase/carboxylesterase
MHETKRTKPLSLVHRVRQPSDVAAGKPPLLILFHGIGSNELSMASLARTLDPRLLVVCPRSPIEMAPRSYCWFHTNFTSQGPVANIVEAEAAWKRVAAFVPEVVEAYDTDPGRAFIGGFSQGAIVSLATLLTAPEGIAGVVAMSGRLLQEVLPHAVRADRLRGKPVLVIHGTQDDTLPIRFGHQARDQLSQFPISLTYREFQMPHRVTDESLAAASSWLSARL